MTTRNILGVYQIRVKGHLDQQRLSTYADLSLQHQPNGQTVLTGPIRDQAALYGLINRLRDMGVPLLSVNCLEEVQE